MARLLQDWGDSLQAHGNTPVKRDIPRKRPVISVDTNKQALVGPSKKAGPPWRNPGAPPPVNMPDFPDQQRGKAMPDGVYALGQHVGGVKVGRDHDTASFAAESLRRR